MRSFQNLETDTNLKSLKKKKKNKNKDGNVFYNQRWCDSHFLKIKKNNFTKNINLCEQNKRD